MLDLFPFLGDVKILRQWAGMSDMNARLFPHHGHNTGKRVFISTPGGAPGASKPRPPAATQWLTP